MADDIRSNEWNESEALRKLGVTAEDLGAAARGPRVEIPAAVDSAVRAAAHERARRIREGGRRILRLPLWIGSVAAAAAVVLAVALWPSGTREAAKRELAATPARPVVTGVSPGRTNAMDIDRSGAVDIVDAYVMSRRLRRLRKGGEAPREWDFDLDGEVGSSDVKAVAVAAVSLEGGWR